MAKQVNRPAPYTTGRAILGAFAGICLGLFVLGLPLFILLGALHPPVRHEAVDQIQLVSAGMGAILGAILGVRAGSIVIFGEASRRLFHPLGMLIGVFFGAAFGAAFASVLIYGPHPRDVRDSIVVTCIVAILGAVGGGFLGRPGRVMILGAMTGFLLVGIVFVLAFQNIKGMIYGALLGAPLGASCGLLLGLHLEGGAGKSGKPREFGPPSPAGVWDEQLDG
jgi:hypothetical protein